MISDIKTREDIKVFIHQFYSALLKDEILSHFFEDLVKHHKLEDHLTIIVDFWEDLLFQTTNYSNNAMKPHMILHKTKPFSNEHFEAWLGHFNRILNANFKGEKVEFAKTRALSIATVMKIKMQSS